MSVNAVVVLLLAGITSYLELVHARHDILAAAGARATLYQQQQQQLQRHLLAAGDKPASLTVAGPDCIEAFYNTTAQHYSNDEQCTFMINQAFAATAQNACPEGGTAAGSPVHQCLQKSEGATAAWVSFITKCPLANVLQGGEDFSCFQRMATPAEFEAYAGSAAAAAPPASRSSSGRLALGSSAVLLYVALGLLSAARLL